MAAWPPISNRSIPINNTTAIPATTEIPMPSSAAANGSLPPTTPLNGLNSTEVNFDPDAHSNPYFLHANENPALVLVSTPMDGSNYHPWARAMTMALSCKNKLAFVNGVITKPPLEDRRYQVWERCNDTVKSWIVRSLSPTVGGSVLWIDTAYEIWNDLKRRFSKQDLFRIAEIKCEIYQIKQGESSLNEYFTKQKLLWDELMNTVMPTKEPCQIIYPVIEGALEEPPMVPQPHNTPEHSSNVGSEEPSDETHNCDTGQSPSEQSTEQPSEQFSEQSVTRKSTRQRHTPTDLKDYICHNSIVRTSPHNMAKVLSYAKLSPSFQSFAKLNRGLGFKEGLESIPNLCPLLPYSSVRFHNKNPMSPLLSRLYSPGAGSSQLFHDVNPYVVLVRLLYPNLEPGRFVSVGWSKLSQSGVVELMPSSLKTKFPLSRRVARTEFFFTVVTLRLVDQTKFCAPSTSTRSPSRILSFEDLIAEEGIGVTLFATQTTV
nr:uncharacterized protein LOC109181269 [Ipomoea batatas]